ncbi:MAG: hypothetical protein KDI19_16510, partial [Pseudomonadales bacterium]|nr:hypothetical protein [Pseudomonadales bacterium]
WSRGDFELVEPGPILEVESQVISGRMVITRGEFKPFRYGGQVLGPWAFLIRQEFNDDGEIIFQEDWINYSPKKILIGG